MTVTETVSTSVLLTLSVTVSWKTKTVPVSVVGATNLGLLEDILTAFTLTPWVCFHEYVTPELDPDPFRVTAVYDATPV